MSHELEATHVPALSLLASLTIRDLDELDRGDLRLGELPERDSRLRRLSTLHDVLESAERGAEPVYEQIAQAGGSLLDSTSLHLRVASLDEDLGAFTLISQLRGPSEQPDQIKRWAHRINETIEQLLKVDWPTLSQSHRNRLRRELRPFLLQLERLDEHFADSASRGEQLLT